MRVVLMMAVMTAALAGCFGGDDEPQGAGPDNNTTAPPDHNTTFPPGNNTTQPPGNNTTQPPGNNTTQPGNNTTQPPSNNTTGNGSANVTWAYDNRSGDVSGNFLIITGPSAVEESVSIANGTLMLFLNITVEGDDLVVTVAPPGCEEESCQTTVDVSSGTGSFDALAPDEGAWTVSFEPDGGPVGGFEASYELAIIVGAASAESEDEDEE